MKHLLLSFVLTVIAALGLAPSAQAQTTAGSIAYMKVMGGSKLGDILGEVTQKGREGQHGVLAFSHEIVSPRDAASGLPTGKRQHQPFRVVKLLNKGTPLLTQALANNETFKQVVIDFWAASAATGAEVKVLSYTLNGASVVSIRPWMPNRQDSSTTGYTPAEEISFVYQSITTTYWNGGIESTVEWGQ